MKYRLSPILLNNKYVNNIKINKINNKICGGDIMANNIPKSFIDQMGELIEGLIKNSGIPTIKSCRIVTNNGNGTYKVKRGNELHNVIGRGTYSVDSVVQVILPDGKWSRAMIITPPLSSGSSGGSADYTEVIKSIAKINEQMGNTDNLPYDKTNIVDSLNTHDKDSSKHMSSSDREAINNTSSHISNKENPHNVTKEQLGLGNVENKSAASILKELTTNMVKELLGNEYSNTVTNSHTHENKGVIDNVTQEMVDVLDEIVQDGFKITVDDALSTESVNPVQNKVITTAINNRANKEHTHNYAGSDVSSGAAKSAEKLHTPRKINGIDFDGTKDIRVTDEVIKITKEEYEQKLKDGTIDENTYYLVTNDETNNLVADVSGFFTLAMDGWDLVAYYSDDSTTAPPITFDPETWNLYYEVPDE